MRLTPEHVIAAEAITAILDVLNEQHEDASVIWLAQALAAYRAASDGEIPVAISAAQHVRMRRAADSFLGSDIGAHDLREALTEILLLEGGG